MPLLTVAGSDSGGGAGLQADLKTFAALGEHGASAVTCVTAQNTRGVQGVESVSSGFLERQIRLVLDDFDVSAAKTGAIPDQGLVEVAASDLRHLPLVVDPVAAAEAGGALATDEALRATVEHLVPVADAVTPNVEEAELLTGIRVQSPGDAEDAARALLDRGAGGVVVTGGHTGGAVDVVVTPERTVRLDGDRVPGRFHGTGCTFSAALTASIGRGSGIEEAARFAKAFTASAIRGARRVGGGPSPVDPLHWLTEGRS